jgi:hypothetical protein
MIEFKALERTNGTQAVGGLMSIRAARDSGIWTVDFVPRPTSGFILRLTIVQGQTQVVDGSINYT